MFFTRRNPFVQFKNSPTDLANQMRVNPRGGEWRVLSQRAWWVILISDDVISLYYFFTRHFGVKVASDWLIVTLSVFFVDVISGQVRSPYSVVTWLRTWSLDVFIYSHMASHFFIFFLKWWSRSVWDTVSDDTRYCMRYCATVPAVCWGAFAYTQAGRGC